jgi:hypothetical protein
MTRHHEASTYVPALAADVFARLDDQVQLGEHMNRSSAMMGGGRMTYDFDEGRGRAVGSHIRMGGEAFGLKLFIDEVVTEREPPRRKVWKTVGAPRMLVVGGYTMGFDIAPAGSGARLTVWIDYDLPDTFLGALAGPLLAPMYASWCVERMVGDAKAHFEQSAPAQSRAA